MHCRRRSRPPARPSPPRRSPNAITLTGLALQAAAFGVAFAHAPDMASAPPAWTFALTAAAMFFYSTMDNMDGKQARRTGTSSPLGLLFDHGCDAVNVSLLGWAAAAVHLRVGPGQRAALLWATTTLPFYTNTWEEYHTGAMVLPVLNGPNEGVFGTIALLLAAAYALPDDLPRFRLPPAAAPALAWAAAPAVDALRALAEPAAARLFTARSLSGYVGAWLAGGPAGAAARPPGAQPSLEEGVLAFLALAALVTAAAQAAAVLPPAAARGGLAGAAKALARGAPYAALLACVAAWHAASPATARVATEHWALFLGAAGALFTDLAVRLMLAHVTASRVSVDAGGLLVFGATPALAALGLLDGSPLGSPRALASAGLLAALVAAALPAAALLLAATREVADALDIDVLVVDKQVARNAARARAAAAAAGGSPATAADGRVAAAYGPRSSGAGAEPGTKRRASVLARDFLAAAALAGSAPRGASASPAPSPARRRAAPSPSPARRGAGAARR